jgi:hypothetical protein
MADEVVLIAPDALLRQDTRIPVEKDDHDALAAKRTAIKRVMTNEIEAILGPLGYVRAGDTWRRNSALATSALQLQSSTYGFGLFINAFAGPRHRSQFLPPHRLAKFCPELGLRAPDELGYLRLHDDPAFRAGILTVVRARMVPWMQARHGLLGMVRRPDPADMIRVPVFATGHETLRVHPDGDDPA